MGRPELHEVPLMDADPDGVTMREGEWNCLLRIAYDHGCILIELDDNELPVRAFRKSKMEKNILRQCPKCDHWHTNSEHCKLEFSRIE